MIIGQIEEILYFPSLRCNLNCKHCGEDQDVPQREEVDGALILDKIQESVLVDKNARISVTGGEPFLNSSFPAFILEGLRRTSRSFYITSNGFLYDDIVRMVDQIDDSARQRLSFSVSIDGLEQTHNAIRRNPDSFARALKTAKYLADRGLLLSTNTVIQESNLEELDDIKLYFATHLPGIYSSMGPIGIDCAEDRNYEYSGNYQERSWSHLYTGLYRKQVLARGSFRIRRCHAGIKNIVIGPDGKVYSCLTGAFYRGKDERSGFCLGDLKIASLDEILTNMERRKSVLDKVSSCEGCSDNYTMDVENRVFGLDTGLTADEALRALELEQMYPRDRGCMLEEGLLDTGGWHETETDADHRWCWSSELVSRVFVPTTGISSSPHAKLLISYEKIVESQQVKVLVDGVEAEPQLGGDGRQIIVIEIPCETQKPLITVTFIVDKLYRPCDIFENADFRQMGICLTGIRFDC